MRIALFSILLAGLALFTSCDDAVLFEENKAIPNHTWPVHDEVSFNVDILDTTQLHNFYLNLRHGGTYPYANMFVFVKTTFPNEKVLLDTVELPLADPTGRWYGSGLGDIVEHQILYKFNRRFPLTGTYTFSIEHGMREEELEEVYDVGLRLERAE